MSDLPVPVSTSPTATFALIVDAVDFELRVVEDAGHGQVPIFDASKGDQGSSCALLVQAEYVLRYNNNDGGAGVLHFRIVERGAQEVTRKEVRLGAISTPIVLDFVITLQPSPAVAPA